MQEIAKHSRKARIALVGHEPNIGELAARLIGARSPIEFKKGAICRIDFDGAAAEVARHAAVVPAAADSQARALTRWSRACVRHPINSLRTMRCAARAASVS